MKLNQLADQLHAKTIGLIAIAKALEFSELPNPHGGTPLNPAQAQQITTVFRYMRDRQIVDAKAAIAQMNEPMSSEPDQIAVSLRVSVADELRRRYPEGNVSDRILKLLGAVSALETLHLSYRQQPTAETADI
jgi:hypothetical protein